MKKLLLSAVSTIALCTALPVAAQYYVVPNLAPGRNPAGVNTDGEGRYDLGQPGWSLLVTGDATTQAAPAWSAVQALPFAFQLNGQSFTSYKVSTSGVLTFTTAAVAVPPTSNAVLPSVLVPDNSVCVWGTLMTANTDYLISKTFGAAPRRQHWVQFNSVSLPLGATSTPIAAGFVYCSIVLEEGTNKVYFVWQRSGLDAQTLTVGVQQNGTTALQLAASPNVSLPNLADAGPADNQYYEFVPGTQPTLDVAGDLLRLPNTAPRLGSVSIRGRLRNIGTQTINSLTANYRVGNGPVVSAPLTGLAVASLDTAAFVHPTPWQPTAGGVLPVKAWFSAPNGGLDQQAGNDTVRTFVVVGDSTMRRKVLEEDFTSSTCPPCRPGNINTRAVNSTPAIRGKFVDIKYQQNFPAPGNDPYYTLESGARFGHYNGAFVPYMVIDGSSNWNTSGTGANSNAYTAADFLLMYNKPALARVSGTYELPTTGTLTATARVKPLFATPAGRLVLHMAVTERETRNNARTNGETRFYDVMKKMLPNQAGTLLPALVSGQVFTLTQTFDPSTLPVSQAVENFDSLQVVVFVQDVVTKEVYQAESLKLLRPLATRSAQSGPAFSLAPNPATGRTTLFLTLARAGLARVEVLDALGRVVLARPAATLGAGAQQLELDLARRAAGLYTVRLTTAQGVSTRQLAVE